MNNTKKYWFIIEPYVYINIANKRVLLYNTLDGTIIESERVEIVALLKEVLQEENCGVLLLDNKQLEQFEINDFVKELRKKYMGDIIDTSFSKEKPVQILPYFNYPHWRTKKCDFRFLEYISQALFKIYLHIDYTTDILKLITRLQRIPDNVTFNILGDWREIKNGYKLIDFFNERTAFKNISCYYIHIPILDSTYKNGFSYEITVCLPINKQLFEKSIKIVQSQDIPYGYIFNISSLNDYQKAEQLIEEYHIEKYQLKPIYTGENIHFFKDNIFLTEEDILSSHITMKDFFIKRLINKNDFGKLHIMQNGDVYANINHPIIGNIFTNSIDEIIQKEFKEGKSWLRIRNQDPCDKCLYQDLCPSPSDYEIEIGYPNLCHVQLDHL